MSSLNANLELKFLDFKPTHGGEFLSFSHPLLLEQGIQHYLMCAYTHEENDTIEQKICHIVDTTVPLILHASVPQCL